MSELVLDPVIATPIGPPPPAPDVPVPMPPPPPPVLPPEGDPPPVMPPVTDPGFPPPVVEPPPMQSASCEVRFIYRSAGWPCCDAIEV